MSQAAAAGGRLSRGAAPSAGGQEGDGALGGVYSPPPAEDAAEMFSSPLRTFPEKLSQPPWIFEEVLSFASKSFQACLPFIVAHVKF